MYFKVILKKYFNLNQGTYLCQMYTFIIYYMLRRLCFLTTVLNACQLLCDGHFLFL